ncbi:MAG: hypothetical protein HN757_15935 [Calditrichaeota bacterium]|nr:hypothetical protein [Calditrichota bacterium]
MQILTNDQGKTIPLFGCPRRIILCSVENREPHHIFSNLSYSDLINICLTEDDPQKDEIDSFKVGFYPSVCSIAAITAFIARYLWLQSLENKEGKGNAIDLEHKRSRIILQELTNIPPDFDDPGFDLKFKHQELLQNDLNCVFPVIGETVKLADNLYELVEYIVLKNSDLEQTGTLGPWNFGGFQFKVSYFGPQAVTRCIFVKFSDYNVTLDFQGKGWVFLELNGTTRFSQRLFSRTPSNPPKKDSLEGDIDLFLKIGHQVLTVAQKENNM